MVWKYIADPEVTPGYPGFPFGDIEEAEFDALVKQWEPMFLVTHGKAKDSGNWKQDLPAGKGGAESVIPPPSDPAGVEVNT